MESLYCFSVHAKTGFAMLQFSVYLLWLTFNPLNLSQFPEETFLNCLPTVGTLHSARGAMVDLSHDWSKI